jgi:hypothetical protein
LRTEKSIEIEVPMPTPELLVITAMPAPEKCSPDSRLRLRRRILHPTPIPPHTTLIVSVLRRRLPPGVVADVARICCADVSFRGKHEPALALDPSHGRFRRGAEPSRTTVRRPASVHHSPLRSGLFRSQHFLSYSGCAGPSARRATPVLDRMPLFWKLDLSLAGAEERN